MTVCIAAILPKLRKIVLVSDELISFGWTSAEGRLKLETLGPNERWNVMFSATDARRVPALIQSIRDALDEKESAKDVIAACKAGYRDQFGELFDTRIGKFGLTRKEFEKKGRAYFGAAGLADLSEEFAKKDLGIDLLVAGFDEKHDMLLFEVSGQGEKC